MTQEEPMTDRWWRQVYERQRYCRNLGTVPIDFDPEQDRRDEAIECSFGLGVSRCNDD